MYNITPMSYRHAQEISGWIYPAEYAVYSFQKNGDTMDELMNGEYFACAGAQGELAGYFCFGKSAQIPTAESSVYGADRLDIGLGLRPEWCGKGLGADFMKAGMAYAAKNWGAAGFRLTVACFNKRAQNLYAKLGFRISGEVTHQKSKAGFYVMIA